MKAYHIGLIKGIPRGLYANGHKADTLIIQCRRNVDYLSPDLWRYEGQRITTKARLIAQSVALLTAINELHGTAFRYLVFD